MKIKNYRDFWAGILFMAFGLAFIVFARDYNMGTAAKMGPAYFPTVLGGLLSVLGAAITI
ncbi:MAG: tripartite tricarboxylate transporter TctB family protein, partial [Betaproteobacteria bacterium]|nr:tripartite tricarboxylate transporter TctB family protein [Betaproteobacteria bacterium]